MQEIAVKFAENPQDEIKDLIRELRILPLVDAISQNGEHLSKELKNSLVDILKVLSDMFSTSLPELEEDPEKNLRAIARDIQLGRILRERGLFRMFLFTRKLNQHGAPVWMDLINPVTGSPFGKQEELITWFCEEASVARSLVFMRIATIERTLTLGYSIEEAFRIISTKPSVIRDTLNLMGEWNGGTLVKVNPDYAVNLAKHADPENASEIERLVETGDTGGLIKAIKPAMAQLILDVDAIDRARDAMRFVKHDVLLQPAFDYRWDEDAKSVVITMTKKSIDPETGLEYEELPISIYFMADSLYVPPEIITDLRNKLPFKD